MPPKKSGAAAAATVTKKSTTTKTTKKDTAKTSKKATTAKSTTTEKAGVKKPATKKATAATANKDTATAKKATATAAATAKKETSATAKKNNTATATKKSASAKQNNTATASKKDTSATAKKNTATATKKTANKAVQKMDVTNGNAPATENTAPVANESKKRKASTEDPDNSPAKVVGNQHRPIKKARKATEPAKSSAKDKIPLDPVINEAPKERLNIYVFGEGSSGELGLGTEKKAIDVKRPRLNALLDAQKVGVVDIAVGGMHCVALTHDNKIYTWGVNDQGALGRDTKWEGGLIDIEDAEKEDSDSDSDDDTGMNPKEATPAAIPDDAFPEGTIFTSVAAGDSCSFAITDRGLCYGWGTFRCNEGILGFRTEGDVVTRPMRIPELRGIKSITCGANHVLTLNTKGGVFAFGSGQQNQLGRRVVERTRVNGLTPREIGFPRRRKIKFVECGSYHSFAIDENDQVWAWGSNTYGETGIYDGAGEDNAIVLNPRIVDALEGKEIVHIRGGNHHSIAVTKNKDCLVWGRSDGGQLGLKIDELPREHFIHDEKDKPRILTVPTPVPGFKAAYATAGSDTSIAITTSGQAYSWGFSANYQTGQGTDDDVPTASLIDNTAVRGKKLTWAGAGGQFSVLTGPAQVELTNGVVGGDHPMVNGL